MQKKILGFIARKTNCNIIYNSSDKKEKFQFQRRLWWDELNHAKSVLDGQIDDRLPAENHIFFRYADNELFL